MILKKEKNKAFTIIELMIWITLISILIIWSTSIDFNSLSIKQKLEIFTNSIKSEYESTRNNALIWKWIWTDLIVPEKWRIEYSKSNSWTIITSTYDWINWNKIDNILFEEWYYISKISCLELDETLNNEIDTWTWIVEFNWSNISLSWDCTNQKSKILELEFTFKAEKNTLTINSLNWLIEKK